MVYIVISLLLSLFSSGFVLFFLLTLAKDLFKILFQDIGVFCLVYSTKLPPEKVCFLVWLNLLCRGANLLKFAVALMIFDPLLQQYRRNLKNRIFCQFTERKRTWDVKDSHLLLSAPTFTSRQLYLGELWPLNSWASVIKNGEAVYYKECSHMTCLADVLLLLGTKMRSFIPDVLSINIH